MRALEPVAESCVCLKKVLREAGLAQAQLAQRTGIHRTVISRISTGRMRPSAYEKVKIAEALGKSVREIFPE